MKILNFQERVNFVDDVVSMCNVIINDSEDKTYHPAMFDIAFRFNVIKYFVNAGVANDLPENICKFVYDYDLDDSILCTPQIIGLKEACKEEIDRSHKEFLAYAIMNKPSSFDELLDYIKEWLENIEEAFKDVDVDKLMEVANKLSEADKQQIATQIVKNSEKKSTSRNTSTRKKNTVKTAK